MAPYSGKRNNYGPVSLTTQTWLILLFVLQVDFTSSNNSYTNIDCFEGHS